MNRCKQCGGGIGEARMARVLEHLGRPATLCRDCVRKNIARRERNEMRREQNAILRELCGTSARAARLDMGMA